MTARVRQLRDEMRDWEDMVCLERPRIVTESFRRTKGEPWIIRRAKALRDVLAQMPLYLREGDLIVGTPTSTPGAWISYPEFSLGTESIVQMRHNFSVGPNFIRDALPGDVKEYWETRNLYARYRALRRECFGDSQPPPEDWYQLSTALGHVTPDFSEVLRHGLEGVRARAEARLEQIRGDDPAGAEFLRAVTVTCEGAMAFARRYGELAGQLAEGETQPTGRAELEQM
ncbi:MAG: pyruvate formate lyase family protein, partial [Armatimonadota bacterium]